jgi:hypothetical protein
LPNEVVPVGRPQPPERDPDSGGKFGVVSGVAVAGGIGIRGARQDIAGDT